MLKSRDSFLVSCSKNDLPLSHVCNLQVAKLPFLINDGKWHHICVTWTTRDGVWEAFQDGVKRGSGENLAPYHPIKPQGLLILGQEQVCTLTGAVWVTRGLRVVTEHTAKWKPVLQAVRSSIGSKWKCISTGSPACRGASVPSRGSAHLSRITLIN